jgi:hypothetical protein
MTALDVHAELWIDAAWEDITADLYTRAPVTITRGRTAESGQVEPSSCTLTVNNRDGNYSPRNPAGAYFGKIGRNTPIRVRVGADVRFVGEVSAWPVKWDKPGKDVYVTLDAAGVMRRLEQGSTPAPSAPRTFILGTDPAAYWAVEDGPQTIHPRLTAGAGSTIRLSSRAVAAPQVWGQGKLADWLAPTAKIETEALGTVLRADVGMSGFTDTWTVEMIRSGGGSATPTVGSSNMTAIWRAAGEQNPTSTIVRFNQLDSEVVIDIDFSELAAATIDGSFWDDNPHHVRLTATQDGADIDYQVWIDGVLALSTTDTSDTLGPVEQVSCLISVTVSPALTMGHWAVWTDPPALADSVGAAFGHQGETAGRRIERLCTEHSIPFASVGDLDDTAPMGPQAPLPPLELLREAAQADHGILYESRAQLGLEYRTRASLHNQTPALTTDYSARVFYGLPEPVDDDRFTRNDVTTKRPNSGEGHAALEVGPLSVQDPPDGVGPYDTSVTVNTAGDGFLHDHAGWLLNLGTVDEARFPRLSFRLNAVPGIAADIAGLELGDLVRITDLPSWLPPDDVDVLIQGTEETLGSHMRDIDVTTAPAAPYTVAEYEEAAGDATKCDTASTIRGMAFATINTTQTVITFETLIGPPWTQDDDEFPFDIYVGGERMTVTDIAGTGGGAYQQSFTVTRSVNGVVKSHAPGTAVRLWDQARVAL